MLLTSHSKAQQLMTLRANASVAAAAAILLLLVMITAHVASTAAAHHSLPDVHQLIPTRSSSSAQFQELPTQQASAASVVSTASDSAPGKPLQTPDRPMLPRGQYKGRALHVHIKRCPPQRPKICSARCCPRRCSCTDCKAGNCYG